jgi:2-keto-4-pentenoate hydratase
MTFNVDEAAALLIESRQAKRLARVFSPGPHDASEAYAVQTAIARQLGPVGGWKVGAKSSSATPTVAPLLSDLMQAGPAKWASSALNIYCVEPEIAFHIGRDIAPRAEPLCAEEVYASVTSIHASIEIVDTRLAGWKDVDPLWKLADNQSNGGFVFDPKGSAWNGESLADAHVRLTIDGEMRADQRGGNPAGDPRWLLVWLVNHCTSERGGISAGSFVTTGSYAGMIFVEPNASVEVEFAGIGHVSLSLI